MQTHKNRIIEWLRSSASLHFTCASFLILRMNVAGAPAPACLSRLVEVSHLVILFYFIGVATNSVSNNLHSKPDNLTKKPTFSHILQYLTGKESKAFGH